jgi:hypothetical protein
MLDFWRDEFLMQGKVEHSEDFPFVIIGNKKDLLLKITDDNHENQEEH